MAREGEAESRECFLFVLFGAGVGDVSSSLEHEVVSEVR